MIRFYIKLNQPRKEDGNTFGVEVQNEIISDMNDAMDGARQLLTDMISYFSTRASIIAAVGQQTIFSLSLVLHIESKESPCE